MKQVRICWLPSVVYQRDVQHEVPSCSGWQAETRENALDMRLLCAEANKLYGPGSHWVETRDVLAVSDFLPEASVMRRTVSTAPARPTIAVQHRLHISDCWRLMMA